MHITFFVYETVLRESLLIHIFIFSSVSIVHMLSTIEITLNKLSSWHFIYMKALNFATWLYNKTENHSLAVYMVDTNIFHLVSMHIAICSGVVGSLFGTRMQLWGSIEGGTA